MEILNSRLIKKFIRKHNDADIPLQDWMTKASTARWRNNSDVHKTFNNAEHLGKQKFIFNIGGNNFRMVAMVWIVNEKVYILKLLTHAEYDKEKF